MVYSRRPTLCDMMPTTIDGKVTCVNLLNVVIKSWHGQWLQVIMCLLVSNQVNKIS